LRAKGLGNPGCQDDPTPRKAKDNRILLAKAEQLLGKSFAGMKSIPKHPQWGF
jgi:hypothetical protein